MKKYTAYDWFILVVLACIWGSSFILMKRILHYFSPVEMALLRIGISGLVLLPLFLRSVKGKTTQQLGWFFVSGMLGNAVPALCFALTQTKLNSSVAASLNALTPFFALLIGVVVFKNKLSRNSVFGLALGLLGALMLSFFRANGSTELHFGYAGFAVLATFCYGLNINLIRAKFQNFDAITITSLAVGLVGLPCVAATLLFTPFVHTLQAHPQHWLGVGYAALLGCFGTAFALVLFNGLIKRTNAVFASSVTYLIPVVAMVIGSMDGERLGLPHFMGILAILLGIYITTKK